MASTFFVDPSSVSRALRLDTDRNDIPDATRHKLVAAKIQHEAAAKAVLDTAGGVYGQDGLGADQRVATADAAFHLLSAESTATQFNQGNIPAGAAANEIYQRGVWALQRLTGHEPLTSLHDAIA
jgi:hypothetical protein